MSNATTSIQVRLLPTPTLAQTSRLRRIAPPQRQVVNWQLKWLSPNILAVVSDSDFDRASRCLKTKWVVYDLTQIGTPRNSDETECIPSHTVNVLDLAPNHYSSEQIAGETTMIEGQVLIPTAPIQFGEWPTDTNFVRPPDVTQVWVKRTDNPDLQPLIWSPVGYAYELTHDGKHIIVDSLCYGGLLGRGMYSVQIETHQVMTLHPTITHNCEGSRSRSLSPIGKNIIFTTPQGDILVNLNDMHQMRLCGPEGNSGDYTWSVDGRYVYVVCAYESDYYTIRRIDTDTFMGEDVTDHYQLPLGIFSMAVSPDAKRIAFYRLEGSFFAKKHEGVWVLELN